MAPPIRYVGFFFNSEMVLFKRVCNVSGGRNSIVEFALDGIGES